MAYRGGVLRGAVASWLGLIALHALSTSGGAGRVKELSQDLTSILDRVLDPNVPAIPDRRAPGTGPAGDAPATGAPPTTGTAAGPMARRWTYDY
jgi:hypothetical protein